MSHRPPPHRVRQKCPASPSGPAKVSRKQLPGLLWTAPTRDHGQGVGAEPAARRRYHNALLGPAPGHKILQHASEVPHTLQVLADRRDIRIVGDRFVFQSEVLFASGSADIGDKGKERLSQFADTLRDLIPKIPADINWVLQVMEILVLL